MTPSLSEEKQKRKEEEAKNEWKKKVLLSTCDDTINAPKVILTEQLY